MADATAVDRYLAALPREPRATLEALRATIRAAAPDATETLSYQIPTFRWGGRGLVAFAGFKNHCSFFPMSKAVVEAQGDALAAFQAGKGTLRFTPERPIPAEVVTLIVRARMDEIAGDDRLRRDVAAYQRVPQTPAEVGLADVSDTDLGDDSDWEALHPDATT